MSWAPDAPRPSPIDWPIEKDLAARAHHELEREAGHPLPVELHIHKRIPVGAGLGGGSSDAAAALLLLDEVFGLSRGRDRLAAIGHRLGSDVPFFVDDPSLAGPPRPAIVSGLGERMERTRRATEDVLLIIPPFACATGPVYRAFDRLVEGAATPGRPSDSIAGVEYGESVVRGAAAAGVPGAALFNDLTGAAKLVEPRLAEIRSRAASAAGATAHMTGSGSTLFLVGRGASTEVAGRIARAIPEAVVVRTRLV